MKLESRSGALVVSERMSLPRWAALAAGTAISAALLVTQLFPGRITAQTFIGGVLLALVAFAAAGFMPDREFEFDLGAARLDWCVWRLAYSRGGTIPFDEIRSVEVHADRGEPRQGPASYTLVLVTAAGPLEVTTRREFDRVACERVASALRQRLGLSSVAPDARDAIADLVRRGSLPEAIALASRELGIGLAEARGYVDTLRESKAA
jgi:hypothetical protein